MIHRSSTWLCAASRVLLVCFFVALANLPIPAAQAATTDTRVLPQLQNDAAANPSKKFRVIIQRVNHNTSADTAVPPGGGTKIRDID